MRRSGPRRDTAEIAFQQQKPLQEAKGPLETDLPVSPSGCDLIDLDVCCVAGNFKRPVLPMPASPLLWSAGSVARWHLVLSKAPSRPSAALSMHAVFDSNPRLCGEQEGGGTTGDRCPKAECIKPGVTRRRCGVVIVGDMTVPQFLLEGRAKEDSVSTADGGQQTRDGSTADLVPAKGLKELSGVWRMLQAAARCHGRAREGTGRLSLDPEAHTGRPIPPRPADALTAVCVAVGDSR